MVTHPTRYGMFAICNIKGAGQYYHPRPLMKSNVVVVSINYRLGGLGFLNFGNRHVSGNQVGMMIIIT